MTMNLSHLHDQYAARVRTSMVDEFSLDNSAGTLYSSSYFSAAGMRNWPELLGEALELYDGDWLRRAVSNPAYWLSEYEKRTPSGGTTMARVPVTAAETLSDGEFGRYYMRGVCVVALDEGRGLRVIRIKEVARPRTGSEAKIGTAVDPGTLLHDLRTNIGIDTFLGVPAGPNSGLGVEIA